MLVGSTSTAGDGSTTVDLSRMFGSGASSSTASVGFSISNAAASTSAAAGSCDGIGAACCSTVIGSNPVALGSVVMVSETSPSTTASFSLPASALASSICSPCLSPTP